MSRSLLSNRKRAVKLIAGTLLLVSPATMLMSPSTGLAGGSDCGCETGCDAMFDHGSPCSCGCEESGCDAPCKCRPRLNLPKLNLPKLNMKRTLVYQALDTVAGGIESVLGLDKKNCACDASICDDGCDSAMMGELVVPMPPQTHSFAAPMTIQSSPNHSPSNSIIVQPRAETMGAPIEMSPRTNDAWNQNPPITSPRTQLRMSQPRMMPQPQTGSGQHLGQTILPPSSSMKSQIQQPRTPQLRTPPLPTPLPERLFDANRPKVPAPPIPQDAEDSMFDALTDPFGEDEVHVRRYQPVRPSSYESEIQRNPYAELSNSRQTSSRRARSSR